MFKLKPCPFCGSKRVYVMGNEKHWIGCSNCGAEGPVPVGLYKYKGPAVTAWNKRVGDK